MRIFKHPALRKLAAYLDKKLRGKEAEEIEEHLLACDTDKDVFDGMIEMQEQSDLTGEEIIEVIKQEKPCFEEILGKHEENSQTLFHELNNKKYWQVATVTAAIIICCGVVPVQMNVIKARTELAKQEAIIAEGEAKLAQARAELAKEKAVHAKNHAEASAENSQLAQSKAEKAAEEARNYTNNMMARAVQSSIEENMKPISIDENKFVSHSDLEHTSILFSKYEITVFEFCGFLNHAKIPTEEAENWLGDIQYGVIMYDNNHYSPQQETAHNQVLVTLDGAKAFVQWAGAGEYRLPKPAELKYIAQLDSQNDDIFVGPASMELNINLFHFSENINNGDRASESNSTFHQVANFDNPSFASNNEFSVEETYDPMNLASIEWMETGDEFINTHGNKYRAFRLISSASENFLSTSQ